MFCLEKVHVGYQTQGLPLWRMTFRKSWTNAKFPWSGRLPQSKWINKWTEKSKLSNILTKACRNGYEKNGWEKCQLRPHV